MTSLRSFFSLSSLQEGVKSSSFVGAPEGIPAGLRSAPGTQPTRALPTPNPGNHYEIDLRFEENLDALTNPPHICRCLESILRCLLAALAAHCCTRRIYACSAAACTTQEPNRYAHCCYFNIKPYSVLRGS